MCVAVRKQQHIAGFETKRMSAARFQHGHDNMDANDPMRTFCITE